MTIVPLKHNDKLLIVVIIHPDSDAALKAGRIASLPIEQVLSNPVAAHLDALSIPLRDVAIYIAFEEDDEKFNAALLRAMSDPDSLIPWLRRKNPEPGRAWLAELPTPERS
jgi:hypothetical protein